jgi:hypothetical protein
MMICDHEWNDNRFQATVLALVNVLWNLGVKLGDTTCSFQMSQVHAFIGRGANEWVRTKLVPVASGF